MAYALTSWRRVAVAMSSRGATVAFCAFGCAQPTDTGSCPRSVPGKTSNPLLGQTAVSSSEGIGSTLGRMRASGTRLPCYTPGERPSPR